MGSNMEIKRTESRFTYRIAEKPDGGFQAVPGEPGRETIEAATKAELMQKLKAVLSQSVGGEIPQDLFQFDLGGVKMQLRKQVNITKHAGSDESTAELSAGSDFGAGPITRSGSDTSGTILRVIAGLLAAGAIVYWLMNR